MRELVQGVLEDEREQEVSACGNVDYVSRIEAHWETRGLATEP